MTLLDRILERGAPIPTDPIIAARVERHLRRIKPDPLFRRRLRGRVVNRYVATREGLLPARVPERTARREMGVLGRGVLYASLLTAVSVTAVGAAAQDSLPGDALYGIKRQLEGIRAQIVPPGLRDDLAAIALTGRLEEVEKLAEGARWSQVDAAVAAVEQAAAELDRMTGGLGTAVALDEHAARLTELLLTAPESARHGLERALAATTADGPPGPATPNTPAPGHGAGGPLNGGGPRQNGNLQGGNPAVGNDGEQEPKEQSVPSHPSDAQPSQPEPTEPGATAQPDPDERTQADDADGDSGKGASDAQHSSRSNRGDSSSAD